MWFIVNFLSSSIGQIRLQLFFQLPLPPLRTDDPHIRNPMPHDRQNLVLVRDLPRHDDPAVFEFLFQHLRPDQLIPVLWAALKQTRANLSTLTRQTH